MGDSGSSRSLNRKTPNSVVCDVCNTKICIQGQMEYVNFENNRKLCSDCYSIAILNPSNCNRLVEKMHKFYKELDLEVDKNIPILLIDEDEMERIQPLEKAEKAYWIPLGRLLFLPTLSPSLSLNKLFSEGIPSDVVKLIFAPHARFSETSSGSSEPENLSKSYDTKKYSPSYETQQLIGAPKTYIMARLFGKCIDKWEFENMGLLNLGKRVDPASLYNKLSTEAWCE
ncbi:hypothetical protein ACE6H2_007067 [Prunus campanulata]